MGISKFKTQQREKENKIFTVQEGQTDFLYLNIKFYFIFVFPSHFSSTCELRSFQAETSKILSQLR